MILLTLVFLLLSGCILTHSRLSLSYAAMGLELWFRNMIPSLLPFMILSGVMVRLKLTEKASMIVYPIVRPIYKVRKNVCYAMLMGFLCGFPMGARVVDDLYTRQMITKREGEYLLAFCNNIGPVYFCSFALPLLERRLVLPYLFGMYGIPLLYGLVLRYTRYRDLPVPLRKEILQGIPDQHRGYIAAGSPHHQGSDVVLLPKQPASGAKSGYSDPRSSQSPATAATIHRKPLAEQLLAQTDQSIQAAVQSMLSLGGYMILYNLLNLIPHILLGHPLGILSPLLEISGGLKLLGISLPLYSLLALSFGGMSCIAQTYSCIGNTDLSIGKYVLHKLILTMLNGLYYFTWFQISPASFLR